MLSMKIYVYMYSCFRMYIFTNENLIKLCTDINASLQKEKSVKVRNGKSRITSTEHFIHVVMTLACPINQEKKCRKIGQCKITSLYAS